MSKGGGAPLLQDGHVPLVFDDAGLLVHIHRPHELVVVGVAGEDDLHRPACGHEHPEWQHRCVAIRNAAGDARPRVIDGATLALVGRLLDARRQVVLGAVLGVRRHVCGRELCVRSELFHDSPATSVNVPATSVKVPATSVKVPATDK